MGPRGWKLDKQSRGHFLRFRNSPPKTTIPKRSGISVFEDDLRWRCVPSKFCRVCPVHHVSRHTNIALGDHSKSPDTSASTIQLPTVHSAVPRVPEFPSILLLFDPNATNGFFPSLNHPFQCVRGSGGNLPIRLILRLHLEQLPLQTALESLSLEEESDLRLDLLLLKFLPQYWVYLDRNTPSLFEKSSICRQLDYLSFQSIFDHSIGRSLFLNICVHAHRHQLRSESQHIEVGDHGLPVPVDCMLPHHRSARG